MREDIVYDTANPATYLVTTEHADSLPMCVDYYLTIIATGIRFEHFDSF
jgi:hypothetical protein